MMPSRGGAHPFLLRPGVTAIATATATISCINSPAGVLDSKPLSHPKSKQSMPPSSSSSLLLLLLISISSLLTADADADADVSVVSHPSKVVLPPVRPVDGSPGARSGVDSSCNRVLIRGFSRLRHPSKYAKTLKVKVSVDQGDAIFRIQTIEICFHKNFSLGVGMCPPEQWQKLSKATRVKLMSPYEERLLDVRMLPDPSRKIEVSTEEEFLVHRLVFLVVGVVLMLGAHSLSESIVFYYGGAMTLGIIVVMLIILFQGMKLLPTGRKSSLAIFLYASLVGAGTFLLSYVSRLLRTVLVEIGISEDMYNPLGMVLLAFLVLAGAWFGYWGVRKLVLTEEGLVDSNVADFVKWATLIFSAVLILESSLDIIFAAELLCLTMFIVALAREKRLQFLRRMLRRAWNSIQRSVARAATNDRNADDSWSGRPHYIHGSGSSDSSISDPLRAPGSRPERQRWPLADGDDYYSTFHRTPERRQVSEEEWRELTEEQTEKAMTELVSSPEFQRWALENINRIQVTPVDRRSRRRMEEE